MAVVQAIVSQQIKDNLGVTASMPLYFEIDDGSTIADMVGFLQTAITATDAVTDGLIVQVGATVTVPLPSGLKSAPAATAEVERNGLFNFLQEDIKYRFGVAVPAFKASLIANGKINLAAAAVTAFTQLISNYGAPGSPDFTSTSYYSLKSLSDALLSFRKHRKAETRRSVENP